MQQINRTSVPRAHKLRTRIKRVSTALAAFSLTLVTLIVGATPAHAAVTNGNSRVPGGLGYMVSFLSAAEPDGVAYIWYGEQNPAPDGTRMFCIQEGLPSPKVGTGIVSESSLTAATVSVPGYQVTDAQMAYLLSTYQSSQDRDTVAALSLLVHTNFEIDSTPGTVAGKSKAQDVANLVASTAESTLPHVAARAKQLAVEAKNSGVKGYESDSVDGVGKRTGTYTGFALQYSDGRYIPGVEFTAKLNGPAIWDENGSTTLTLTTTDAGKITKAWSATGNGDVKLVFSYKDPTGTLKRYVRDGLVQGTIKTDPSRTETTGDGPTWRVIYDFQPIGVSHIQKITDTGVFTDTLSAQADPAYGGGEWVQVDGTSVPVVYTATAYQTGSLELPAQASTVPSGVEIIGTQKVTAQGPSDLKASFTAPTKGWYTVVWEVKKEDQSKDWTDFIHADWADGFALDEETGSFRWDAQIDSTLSIRTTKSGTYLVDDVWVTGMPSNHGAFTGGKGFKPDVQEIAHKVLFFPHGLSVTESNRSQAEQIGETVTIAAKNGFYPSVGDTSWLLKTDKDGAAVPGTYVFISEFAGDDRVKPLVTSVEDVTEQFTVKPEPSLHTTLMYDNTKNPVPAEGVKELVDRVCYTNVETGKKYTVTGTLMDKATGKALHGKDGKAITSSTSLTPHEANGCVDVTFTVDTSLFESVTTVAFEKLLHEGKEVAVHADLEDENQTIEFTKKLKTTATDKVDGDHQIEASTSSMIVDKVCAPNKDLTPRATYVVTASLMMADGKPLLDKDGQQYTATQEFTPQAADECAEIAITFDSTGLEGKSVVVFEDVTQDGVIVGIHHDLNDKDQTVTIPRPELSRPELSRPELPHTGASSVGGIAGMGIGLSLAGAIALRLRRQGSGLHDLTA